MNTSSSFRLDSQGTFSPSICSLFIFLFLFNFLYTYHVPSVTVSTRVTKIKTQSFPSKELIVLWRDKCVNNIIHYNHYIIIHVCIRYSKNRRKSAQVFLFESCGGEILTQMMIRVMKETAGGQNLCRGQRKFFFWKKQYSDTWKRNSYNTCIFEELNVV